MELPIRLPQEKSRLTIPLFTTEQNQLRVHVLSDPSHRKLGLFLGTKPGLRIGMICGLKWSGFDLEAGTVQVNRTVSRISCGDSHTKVVI